MHGFRRFIIKTAEVMMVFIIILSVLGFAVSGATSAQISFGDQYWIAGALIGGVIGLIAAAVVAAYLFLLVEIAENTRPRT
jgi:hypothetical protein